MSEVEHDIRTFFSLYSSGQIAAGQIDDFIDAWHNAGDEETCSLSEYLDMTDDEYAIWVVSHSALPSIVAARRDHRPLADAVADYLAELRRDRPHDRPAIHILSHWLQRHVA